MRKKGLPVAIANRVTVKKLRVGFGHDTGGMSCDIYLDGKKWGDLYDDGWGGETRLGVAGEQVFAAIEASKKRMEDFLRGEGYDAHLFANGWNFIKSASNIGLVSLLDEIATHYIEQAEDAKYAKKLEKMCETKIVAADPANPGAMRYWDFKRPIGSVPVATLIANLTSIRAKLAEDPGMVIVNKNLPAGVL